MAGFDGRVDVCMYVCMYVCMCAIMKDCEILIVCGLGLKSFGVLRIRVIGISSSNVMEMPGWSCYGESFDGTCVRLCVKGRYVCM